MIKDPEITVDEALDAVGGNQSALARLVGVQRSSVNEWKSSGRDFIPTLQAYRLQRRMPDVFGDAA